MTANETVKILMLTYPTLFNNKLDALTHIFTSSEFKWKNGELVCVDELSVSKVDINKNIRKMKKRIVENKLEMEKDENIELQNFFSARDLEYKIRLRNYRFIVKNIDLVSSNFIYQDGETSVVYRTLMRLSRFWGGYELNVIPNNITEDWKFAIKGWISELQPIMNSTWGFWDEQNLTWNSVKEIETFTKIKSILKRLNEIDKNK